MKINQIQPTININSVVPKKQNQQQKNYNQNNNFQNTQPKTQSFKGLDGFCLFIANAIENGGLAVSFTLQDMLGTNLPRPFMGLMRNKKENKGKINKEFALKETVREFTTGPSMFIIPAAVMGVSKKTCGTASQIPMNFIKSLGELHANMPEVKAGQALTKTDFYKNVFQEIIKNAKHESEVSQATIDTATNFATRLLNLPPKEPFSVAKLFDKLVNNKLSPLEKATNELADDFMNIVKNNTSNAVANFSTATISNNASASFKKTIKHMESYADDILQKANNHNAPDVQNFIKKLTNKKVFMRLGTNVLMYSLVLAFLQFIPKLYNKAEGKKNAGLTGLMKEETLNSMSNEKTNKQDKSKPSFGCGSSFADELLDKGAKKLVEGNSIVKKVAQAGEFDGINMSFPLLLGVMVFGIIRPRTKQAKDKYDRSEILTRDISACAVMCFAEKALRKLFSKACEKKSGLVLANKPEGFYNQNNLKKAFDYLRPIRGINALTTDQIISKYSEIDKYKNGINGFCEFIEKQGGELNKVFSLTNDSTSIVTQMLGKDVKSATNQEIKETFTKMKDSEQMQNLINLFKDKNNPWVKKAKTLNARFTAFSVILLVPILLGFLLPAFNEMRTKQRVKKDFGEKHNENLMNSAYFMKDIQTSKVFSEISKNAK